MEFVQLTPNAEELLQEILDHRYENENCDIDYWKNRFHNISAAEDIRLRSVMKELIDAEMIEVLWADNAPYILMVLNNGYSYFEIKKKLEKEEKKGKRSDRRHDVFMLIIGAVLGAFVQFLMFKFFGIGG